MRFLNNLTRFIARFRYPVSLPEDIGQALGTDISNSIPFPSLLEQLTSPDFQSNKLKKYMERDQAEAVFYNACVQERFFSNTLCSYCFNEGWIEFNLNFDENDRLRRIYIQHKTIQNDDGIEIFLSSE